MDPFSVPCPVCYAAVDEECMYILDGEPKPMPHPDRVEVARDDEQR